MNNTPKVYRPLVIAIKDALFEIMNKNLPADKFMQGFLKSNKSWGGRDRRFIAECTYEMIRNWRLICFCADVEMNDNSESLLFSKIEAWFILNSYDFSSIKELNSLDPKSVLLNSKNAQKFREIRESIPDWIDEGGIESFKEKWDDELGTLNKIANLYIRPNLLKTNAEDLSKLLTEEGFPNSLHGNAIEITKRVNFSNNDLYKKGYFEFQDIGSQYLIEQIKIKEKDFVIDACAGAGGKSLQIASQRKDRGKILSLDVKQEKIDELLRRAKRNGVKSIEVNLVSKSILSEFKEKADVLIIDAPCSGTGVFRRKPWTKWQISQKQVQKYQQIQSEILENYSKLLKPGGKLLYATCSFLYQENQFQREQFLNNNSEFGLIKEELLYPSKLDSDAFYFSIFEKS